MKKTDQIKLKIHEYFDIAKSRETPLTAKVLLLMAIAYFLWPFDLIPDFIPVIGYLDDLIIVPLLVWLAFREIEKAQPIMDTEKQQRISTEKLIETSNCQEK